MSAARAPVCQHPGAGDRARRPPPVRRTGTGAVPRVGVVAGAMAGAHAADGLRAGHGAPLAGPAGAADAQPRNARPLVAPAPAVGPVPPAGTEVAGQPRPVPRAGAAGGLRRARPVPSAGLGTGTCHIAGGPRIPPRARAGPGAGGARPAGRPAAHESHRRPGAGGRARGARVPGRAHAVPGGPADPVPGTCGGACQSTVRAGVAGGADALPGAHDPVQAPAVAVAGGQRPAGARVLARRAPRAGGAPAAVRAGGLARGPARPGVAPAHPLRTAPRPTADRPVAGAGARDAAVGPTVARRADAARGARPVPSGGGGVAPAPRAPGTVGVALPVPTADAPCRVHRAGVGAGGPHVPLPALARHGRAPPRALPPSRARRPLRRPRAHGSAVGASPALRTPKARRPGPMPGHRVRSARTRPAPQSPGAAATDPVAGAWHERLRRAAQHVARRALPRRQTAARPRARQPLVAHPVPRARPVARRRARHAAPSARVPRPAARAGDAVPVPVGAVRGAAAPAALAHPMPRAHVPRGPWAQRRAVRAVVIWVAAVAGGARPEAPRRSAGAPEGEREGAVRGGRAHRDGDRVPQPFAAEASALDVGAVDGEDRGARVRAHGDRRGAVPQQPLPNDAKGRAGPRARDEGRARGSGTRGDGRQADEGACDRRGAEQDRARQAVAGAVARGDLEVNPTRGEAGWQRGRRGGTQEPGVLPAGLVGDVAEGPLRRAVRGAQRSRGTGGAEVDAGHGERREVEGAVEEGWGAEPAWPGHRQNTHDGPNRKCGEVRGVAREGTGFGSGRHHEPRPRGAPAARVPPDALIPVRHREPEGAPVGHRPHNREGLCKPLHRQLPPARAIQETEGDQLRQQPVCDGTDIEDGVHRATPRQRHGKRRPKSRGQVHGHRARGEGRGQGGAVQLRRVHPQPPALQTEGGRGAANAPGGPQGGAGGVQHAQHRGDGGEGHGGGGGVQHGGEGGVEEGREGGHVEVGPRGVEEEAGQVQAGGHGGGVGASVEPREEGDVAQQPREGVRGERPRPLADVGGDELIEGRDGGRAGAREAGGGLHQGPRGRAVPRARRGRGPHRDGPGRGKGPRLRPEGVAHVQHEAGALRVRGGRRQPWGREGDGRGRGEGRVAGEGRQGAVRVLNREEVFQGPPPRQEGGPGRCRGRQGDAGPPGEEDPGGGVEGQRRLRGARGGVVDLQPDGVAQDGPGGGVRGGDADGEGGGGKRGEDGGQSAGGVEGRGQGWRGGRPVDGPVRRRRAATGQEVAPMSGQRGAEVEGFVGGDGLRDGVDFQFP